MAKTRRVSAEKPAKEPTANNKSVSRVSKKKTEKMPPRKRPRVARPKATALQLTRATNTFAPDFIVRGSNARALFTLTVYRGEGMCLLAMNWKQATPPNNVVGFAIEVQNPGATQFYAIRNRLAFHDPSGHFNPITLSSRLPPFQ